MDKVVLITGGGRGIGAATARLAAARGYGVCVNYLGNRDAAEGVVQEIVATGGEALAVQGDVSLEAEVTRLFQRIDTRFGRLDVLVNNAGMLETQMRVEQMDAGRLSRVFATNVTAVPLLHREAVCRMSTARRTWRRHQNSVRRRPPRVGQRVSTTPPGHRHADHRPGARGGQ
jgi:NAD(P)-dependent dehydrogenase (short-subunit alcohol dehydrogenase family)